MSDRMADKVVESCRVYIEDVEGSLLDEAFQERLEELPEINGEEKAAYIEKNRELLKEHFVPAYEKLAEGLEALKGSGSNDLGIYYFPKGRKYYEYLVRNSIYPSFSTVDELRKAVEEQLEADINAIGIALRRSPELAEKFGEYSFFSQDPQEVLENLQEAIAEDYPQLPDSEYRIKYVPESLEDSMSPAFYMVPPMDRPQENVIYINGGKGSYDTYTLLAHEGFPGHLYQHEYFRRKETQELRHVLNFPHIRKGGQPMWKIALISLKGMVWRREWVKFWPETVLLPKGCMHFWISGLITRAGTGKRPLILSASFFLSATKRQMRFMTV